MQDGPGRYAGLTIDAVLRNSTPDQVGNYRAGVQERALVARLTAAGANVVVHDEQGTSGRDLAKREIARRVLDRVRLGESHGIAYHDVKRLTRDEYGVDPGVIARVLASRRALFVTSTREYRLWLRQDLFDFRQEANLAGNDMLTIRDTMWEGLSGRAAEGVFFGHRPPVGYTTMPVEAPIPGTAGRTRLRREPCKDDGQAVMMAALAEAFDASATLAEVADRMNDGGHYVPTANGTFTGLPRRWERWRVEYVLHNQLYAGQWTWCGNSDQTNEVWETTGFVRPTHDRPDLAYWSVDQVDRWRARFNGQAGVPRPRRRTYEHPLRGVLACHSCGRPMVGAGAVGYVCRVQRRYPGGDVCAHPQAITEKHALRVLRAAIPEAIAECAAWESEVRAELAKPDGADELAGDIRTLEAKIEQATADWYDNPNVGPVPEPLQRRMTQWRGDVDAKRAELAKLERAHAASPARRELVNQLLALPAETMAAIPDETACELIRCIFAEARIAATGWSRGRRFTLASRRNLLLDTEVAEGSRRSDYAYLSKALTDLAA